MVVQSHFSFAGEDRMPNVSMGRHLEMASAVGLWTLALVSSVSAQGPCGLTFVK
jgi:hypothetical protein